MRRTTILLARQIIATSTRAPALRSFSAGASNAARSEPDSGDSFEIVYTDGACSSNGRRDARGGIGVYWGPEDERNVSEPLPPGRQTSNRAEILACARAVEQATEFGVKRLEIRTDSQFTIDCMTQFLPRWKKKNWHRVGGEPILNLDEIRVLDDRRLRFEDAGGRLKFVHVSRHVGDAGNEAADRLAAIGSTMRKE